MTETEKVITDYFDYAKEGMDAAIKLIRFCESKGYSIPADLRGSIEENFDRLYLLNPITFKGNWRR